MFCLLGSNLPSLSKKNQSQALCILLRQGARSFSGTSKALALDAASGAKKPDTLFMQGLRLNSAIASYALPDLTKEHLVTSRAMPGKQGYSH